MYKLVDDEDGEDGVDRQHRNENNVLGKADGKCVACAEQKGEYLLLQETDHHRMV